MVQTITIQNMTPEQFVYWFQGFMEVANPKILDEAQVQQIKNHLEAVFHKVTPIVNMETTIFDYTNPPKKEKNPYTGGKGGTPYYAPENEKGEESYLNPKKKNFSPHTTLIC